MRAMQEDNAPQQPIDLCETGERIGEPTLERTAHIDSAEPPRAHEAAPAPSKAVGGVEFKPLPCSNSPPIDTAGGVDHNNITAAAAPSIVAAKSEQPISELHQPLHAPQLQVQIPHVVAPAETQDALVPAAAQQPPPQQPQQQQQEIEKVELDEGLLSYDFQPHPQRSQWRRALDDEGKALFLVVTMTPSDIKGSRMRPPRPWYDHFFRGKYLTFTAYAPALNTIFTLTATAYSYATSEYYIQGTATKKLFKMFNIEGGDAIKIKFVATRTESGTGVPSTEITVIKRKNNPFAQQVMAGVGNREARKLGRPPGSTSTMGTTKTVRHRRVGSQTTFEGGGGGSLYEAGLGVDGMQGTAAAAVPEVPLVGSKKRKKSAPQRAADGVSGGVIAANDDDTDLAFLYSGGGGGGGGVQHYSNLRGGGRGGGRGRGRIRPSSSYLNLPSANGSFTTAGNHHHQQQPKPKTKRAAVVGLTALRPKRKTAGRKKSDDDDEYAVLASDSDVDYYDSEVGGSMGGGEDQSDSYMLQDDDDEDDDEDDDDSDQVSTFSDELQEELLTTQGYQEDDSGSGSYRGFAAGRGRGRRGRGGGIGVGHAVNRATISTTKRRNLAPLAKSNSGAMLFLRADTEDEEDRVSGSHLVISWDRTSSVDGFGAIPKVVERSVEDVTAAITEKYGASEWAKICEVDEFRFVNVPRRGDVVGVEQQQQQGKRPYVEVVLFLVDVGNKEGLDKAIACLLDLI